MSGARLSLSQLQALWPRLHTADLQPWPDSPAARQAWLALHRGQWQEAVDIGLQAAGEALDAVLRAQLLMARAAETGSQERQALLRSVADRAGGQLMALGQGSSPLARAHFWRGQALALWAEELPVSRALASGLSLQAKTHLGLAAAFAPRHAEALVALAGFHAHKLDLLGPLIAQLSHGANAASAWALVGASSALQVKSPLLLAAQAQVLQRLGEAGRQRARELRLQVLAEPPLEATEARAQAEVRSALHAEPPG